MPSRGTQATIDDLLALGPRVIPHLARNARRNETILLNAYRFAQPKLPKAMQAWLKPPRDRGPIRAAAMELIASLGPLAAYGAVPAVVEGLTDPVQTVRIYAQYAIEWLVPQCPPALKAYNQILADTNQPVPVQNVTVSEPMWSKAPGLVPLLTRHLVQPEHAAAAAIALRLCGSNAVTAIPALIETLDHGFAAPSGKNDRRLTYASLDINRAMAARSLGALGVATPEVIALLARAWNNSNPGKRLTAAQVFGTLSSNIVRLPAEIVVGLDEYDREVLSAKLNALAKAGSVARGAVEAIEKFSETNRLQQWVTDYLDVQDIAMAATVAICCIAPERCADLLPKIAMHINQNWSSSLEMLRELRGCSNEVISALEPLLTATNDQARSTWVAYVILGHNRYHPGAIAALQRNKAQGPITDRMVAAERLFDSTGETNGVWEMIEDGLSPESKLGQWSITLAGKMGPAAIPILRRSLWHKDQFVRQQAGLWLRKLAPEELKLKPSDLR